MSSHKEIFPRHGRPLPPISPITPEHDCGHLRRLKDTYASVTRTAFPGEEVALSVVRNNLKNRLDHARRNHDKSFEALITTQNPDVNLALAHHALSTPEERAAAFVEARMVPAVEAHAELLDDSNPIAGNFPEGTMAIAALAHDFDGEIIEHIERSRSKVMRLVRIAGEEYAVVRSKIDGLRARFGQDDVIELKMRRSGAVALSAVSDEEVRRAFMVLGNITNLPNDPHFIEPRRDIVEEYISSPDTGYKGYIQSYYLAREQNPSDS